MQFGLSFLPDADPHHKSTASYFNEALALSAFADEFGLKFIKMTEHYLHAYGGYCPSPLAFLAAVAAKTKHIRLLTGCLLPVFHHPIQLASEIAMVDALSEGRLEVGFARAYLPYEFDAFQIAMDESRDRYEASIDCLIRLWRESSVTIHSPFFQFDEVKIAPKCWQEPHPPIWGAAVNARQSFAYLAEQGFNLLITPPLGPWDPLLEALAIYREIFETKWGDKKVAHIAISMPLFMDESDERAKAKSEKYLSHYLRIWADATKTWNNRLSSNYPAYQGLANRLAHHSPDKMRTQRQALVGEPALIIQEIYRMREILGIDCILWQIDTGCQPMEVAKKSLDLFVNKVLPNIAG